MRRLSVGEIEPVIRIANYHPTRPGWTYVDREIPDLHFMLIVRGRFRFSNRHHAPVEGGPGCVVFNESTIPHSFEMLDKSEQGQVSSIHCELIPNGRWADGDYRLDPPPRHVTQLPKMGELHQLFRLCWERFQGHQPLDRAACSAIVRLIVTELSRLWAHPPGSTVPSSVQQMLDYLRAHATEPVTRHDLAQLLSVTPEHVNLLFRENLGMTPTEVLHRERCLLAHSLLQSERISVKEVAARVGYRDPFHFSRIFKKVMGVPPSQAGLQ